MSVMVSTPSVGWETSLSAVIADLRALSPFESTSTEPTPYKLFGFTFDMVVEVRMVLRWGLRKGIPVTASEGA
jgi:hypothetical protein